MASRSYSVKENPLNHYSVEDQGVVKKRIFLNSSVFKGNHQKIFPDQNLQFTVGNHQKISPVEISDIWHFRLFWQNLQFTVGNHQKIFPDEISDFCHPIFCRYCLENTNIIIKTHLSRKIHSTIISTTIPYFAIIVWIFLDEPGGLTLPPLLVVLGIVLLQSPNIGVQ